MEIWKDIKDYEELYQVSKSGNIKRVNTNRIVKPSSDRRGYLKVTLSKLGKAKSIRIHRLVAQTFINNPKRKAEVNHKNGIKTDNRVENLEWVTHSENMKHQWENGLFNPNSLEALNKNRHKKTPHL